MFPKGIFSVAFPALLNNLLSDLGDLFHLKCQDIPIQNMVSAENEVQTIFFFPLSIKSWASCSHVPTLAGKLDASLWNEKDWCQGSHGPAETMVFSSRIDFHMNTGNLTKWLKLQKSLDYTWFLDLCLGKKINIKSVLYDISSLVLILAEQFTKKCIANRFLSSPPSFPCLFRLFFLSLKQSPKP